MSTLTVQTSERAPLRIDQVDADSFLFKTIALAAAFGTAMAIGQTGNMDLCASSGPISLKVAWFVLPVTGIAAMVGVATSTHCTVQRCLTAITAVSFTAMWLFGISWAHVGDAINRIGC